MLCLTRCSPQPVPLPRLCTAPKPTLSSRQLTSPTTSRVFPNSCLPKLVSSTTSRVFPNSCLPKLVSSQTSQVGLAAAAASLASPCRRRSRRLASLDGEQPTSAAAAAAPLSSHAAGTAAAMITGKALHESLDWEWPVGGRAGSGAWMQPASQVGVGLASHVRSRRLCVRVRMCLARASRCVCVCGCVWHVCHAVGGLFVVSSCVYEAHTRCVFGTRAGPAERFGGQPAAQLEPARERGRRGRRRRFLLAGDLPGYCRFRHGCRCSSAAGVGGLRRRARRARLDALRRQRGGGGGGAPRAHVGSGRRAARRRGRRRRGATGGR
jgi:hypothetical protein